jgi:hypothetical protein
MPSTSVTKFFRHSSRSSQRLAEGKKLFMQRMQSAALLKNVELFVLKMTCSVLHTLVTLQGSFGPQINRVAHFSRSFVHQIRTQYVGDYF